jgi:hypothetical protein
MIRKLCVICVLIHSPAPATLSSSCAVYLTPILPVALHLLSYFDAPPGSHSASRTGFRGVDGEDGDCTEEDIEREIDIQEAEDDEFLPFTANPR